MKLKSLLPWLCVLGLLVGLGVDVCRQPEEGSRAGRLARGEPATATAARRVEEAKTNSVQADSDELARLRKDNEELLRLRNEVGQLRGEKQQLTPSSRRPRRKPRAPSQVQALRANPAQPAAPDNPPPRPPCGALRRAPAVRPRRRPAPEQANRQRLHQQSSAD